MVRGEHLADLLRLHAGVHQEHVIDASSAHRVERRLLAGLKLHPGRGDPAELLLLAHLVPQHHGDPVPVPSSVLERPRLSCRYTHADRARRRWRCPRLGGAALLGQSRGEGQNAERQGSGEQTEGETNRAEALLNVPLTLRFRLPALLGSF